jgi:hypothetical protein
MGPWSNTATRMTLVPCIGHSDSSSRGERANLGSACASRAGDEALVIADFSFPGKALHPDQSKFVSAGRRRNAARRLPGEAGLSNQHARRVRSPEIAGSAIHSNDTGNKCLFFVSIDLTLMSAERKPLWCDKKSGNWPQTGRCQRRCGLLGTFALRPALQHHIERRHEEDREAG